MYKEIPSYLTINGENVRELAGDFYWSGSQLVCQTDEYVFNPENGDIILIPRAANRGQSGGCFHINTSSESYNTQMEIHAREPLIIAADFFTRFWLSATACYWVAALSFWLISVFLRGRTKAKKD